MWIFTTICPQSTVLNKKGNLWGKSTLPPVSRISTTICPFLCRVGWRDTPPFKIFVHFRGKLWWKSTISPDFHHNLPHLTSSRQLTAVRANWCEKPRNSFFSQRPNAKVFTLNRSEFEFKSWTRIQYGGHVTYFFALIGSSGKWARFFYVMSRGWRTRKIALIGLLAGPST